MANSKISALTSATTPLAGTEVLPVVQSGATKQVSVANLTAGRTVEVGSLSVTGTPPRITADMSNATQANRLLFQTTTANATTSVGAIPNGTGTSSRFNLFNSSDPDNASYLQTQISAAYAIFNSAKLGTGTALPYVWQIGSVTQMDLSTAGNLTLTLGNLVQGTAAKGINFTANTGAAGKTSQLLNWYEEGTWTPTLSFGGASTGITYTTQTGYYTRIGRQVTVSGRIDLSSRGTSTGYAAINGLPFTVNANSQAQQILDAASGFTGLTAGGCLFLSAQTSNTFMYIFVQTTTNRTTIDQTYFNATTSFAFQLTYFV